MTALQRALEESFERHEEHRDLTRRAREKARQAMEADERVRALRRLEHQRTKGRAA